MVCKPLTFLSHALVSFLALASIGLIAYFYSTNEVDDLRIVHAPSLDDVTLWDSDSVALKCDCQRRGLTIKGFTGLTWDSDVVAKCSDMRAFLNGSANAAMASSLPTNSLMMPGDLDSFVVAQSEHQQAELSRLMAMASRFDTQVGSCSTNGLRSTWWVMAPSYRQYFDLCQPSTCIVVSHGRRTWWAICLTMLGVLGGVAIIAALFNLCLGGIAQSITGRRLGSPRGRTHGEDLTVDIENPAGPTKATPKAKAVPKPNPSTKKGPPMQAMPGPRTGKAIPLSSSGQPKPPAQQQQQHGHHAQVEKALSKEQATWPAPGKDNEFHNPELLDGPDEWKSITEQEDSLIEEVAPMVAEHTVTERHYVLPAPTPAPEEPRASRYRLIHGDRPVPIAAQPPTKLPYGGGSETLSAYPITPADPTNTALGMSQKGNYQSALRPVNTPLDVTGGYAMSSAALPTFSAMPRL